MHFALKNPNFFLSGELILFALIFLVSCSSDNSSIAGLRERRCGALPMPLKLPTEWLEIPPNQPEIQCFFRRVRAAERSAQPATTPGGDTTTYTTVRLTGGG